MKCVKSYKKGMCYVKTILQLNTASQDIYVQQFAQKPYLDTAANDVNSEDIVGNTYTQCLNSGIFYLSALCVCTGCMYYKVKH